MSTEIAPRDGVLISFAAGSSLEGLSQALTTLALSAGATSLSAHRERGGDAVAAYLWGAAAAPSTRPLAAFATGPIEATRLKGAKAYEGASFSAAPTCHYVVRTDLEPGWGEEAQRWYDEEHLEGLAACPGAVLAQRALCLDAPPLYYACYDLLDPGVPETAPWLAVRATPWASRVRPRFTNTRRTVFGDLFRLTV